MFLVPFSSQVLVNSGFKLDISVLVIQEHLGCSFADYAPFYHLVSPFLGSGSTESRHRLQNSC